jgi:hypothetical protein
MSGHRLDLVRALGRGVLAQPIDIVEDASRTAYAPDENRILVARSHLDASAPAAIGALTHETGHVHVSRYTLFAPPAKVWAKLWRHSLNAVEEARVHIFMNRRWPGVHAPLAALFATDPELTPNALRSELVAFLAAAAACDRNVTLDFLDSFPQARAAFARTAKARMLYATTVPPTDLSVHPWLGRRYDRLVVPLLLPTHQGKTVDPAEAEVRCAAASAYLVFRQSIWPEVQALFRHDRDRVVRSLSADRLLRAAAGRAGNAAARAALVHQALRRAARDLPDDNHSLWPQRRATRLLRDYLDRMVSPPPALSAVSRVPPPAGAAQAAAEPDVEALVTVLRQALPRSPRRWQGGFRSGSSIDIPRAMQAAATGRDSDRIWLRRAREQPLLAVTLLVDLSGSMQGERIEAAIVAARALSQALSRISRVSGSLSGFQNKLIPFIGFGERPGAGTLAKVDEMRLEVTGTRPGGNNRPRINADGPCLRAAAAELCARPEPDRLLVVISDGQPEDGPDAPAELRAAVAHIQAMPRFTLVGLGLGPETEHVTQYYPIARAGVAPTALAGVIGQLLAARLRTREVVTP